MQAQRGEVVAVAIGSMDVGLQKARTQPRRQFASRRVAAGLFALGQRAAVVVAANAQVGLVGGGIASWMARTSEGKQAWSPVYSMISVGWTMPCAVRALALDDRPDQWTASFPACRSGRNRPRRSSTHRDPCPTANRGGGRTGPGSGPGSAGRRRCARPPSRACARPGDAVRARFRLLLERGARLHALGDHPPRLLVQSRHALALRSR